jgi:phosphatidylglycerophosphate synthase
MFYVGLWQALTSRSSNRANTATLARILALPWILYAVFLMFIALVAIASRGGPNLGEEFFIGVWIVISLAVDLFFGLRAKTFLQTRFRDAATARYATSRSFWSWFSSGPKPNRGA